MNAFRQRQTEAAQRAADRRRRQDEAPRLLEKVPNLETLRLEIQERRAGSPVQESVHVRPVSIPHAPALFEMPCLDSTCQGGGHDVTDAILQSLRSGATDFEGEDQCPGRTGTAECQRVLHYTATATYKR